MEEADEVHDDEDLRSQSKSCCAGGDGLAGWCGGVFGPGHAGCAFV
jgi:hypothetical protein